MTNLSPRGGGGTLSFLAAVVFGAVVGRLLGPNALAPSAARLVPLAWIAAAAQLGVSLLPPAVRDDLRAPALVVSNVLVGAFLCANASEGRYAWAGRVALVGWALNAAVVAANGAMPVSLHAADEVGIEVQDVREGFLFEHENADGSTALPFLADVIPIRLGPEHSVQSAGDLLLLTGIAAAVATGTRRRADETSPLDSLEEVNT